MSGSHTYDFHQREIADLKSAAIYTSAVCKYLERLLEAVKDNRPNRARGAIKALLDHDNQRSSYVDRVDHLIEPVRVPVKVPRASENHRGTDCRPLPTCNDMREYLSAHAAVWAVHSTFREYFWRVWRRGHPTEISCHDVLGAVEEVDSRWDEIRDELREVVDFDCESLLRAVQTESKAAIERCRQSIVAPIEDSTECLVTLSQAAAMVQRSKRTLEGYTRKPGFPQHRVKGKKGQPSLYAWNELRPFLQEQFARDLPEQFPADRFRRD